MAKVTSIVEFNQSDGLPPLVVRKLNNNFWHLLGVSGGMAGGMTSAAAASSIGDVEDAIEDLSDRIDFVSNYENLLNKPKIESVELVGDKTFPQLHMNPITNSELDSILS